MSSELDADGRATRVRIGSELDADGRATRVRIGSEPDMGMPNVRV